MFLERIKFLHLLMVLVFILSCKSKKREERYQEWKKEYPDLKMAHKIRAHVLEIKHTISNKYRNNPHSAYVYLSDSTKWTISTGYEIVSGNLRLDDVIKEDYYLFKRPGNDTLLIVSNDSSVFKYRITDPKGYYY